MQVQNQAVDAENGGDAVHPVFKQPVESDFYVNMGEDGVDKQERDFVDNTRDGLMKTFGFSAEDPSDIVNPMALATVALPLLFVVNGMTSTPNFGSWAQIIPQMCSIIFALMSDSLPLKGLRRKPYIWIGFIGMMLSNVVLTIFGNIDFVAFPFVFIQECSRLLLWIVGDAMVVERTYIDNGRILVICQVMFYVGSFLRSLPQLMGFYNLWGQLVFTFLLPLCLLAPFLPHLKDAKAQQSKQTPDSAKDVCGDVFMVLQTRNTLYILGFTLLYVMVNTCVQVMNIFDGLMDWYMADQWGYALAAIILVAIYAKSCMEIDWHKVFIACSILIAIIVGLGYTTSFVLRSGNAVIAGIMAFSQIPLLLMYTSLCPPGAEATMFYLLQISRAVIAKEMGVQLFFANTFNSLYWIAYLFVLIPLFLLRLVPKTRQHQTELQQADLEMYPGMLLGLVGFVIVFFVFMQWFWNVGYQRVNGEYDGSYYSSDEFWQDWTRFQIVF